MTNQLFPSKNELFVYLIKNDQSNPVVIEEVVVLFQYQIYSKILALFSLEAFFNLIHVSLRTPPYHKAVKSMANFRKHQNTFLHKNTEPETYIISICLSVEIMAKIWN